MAAGDHLFQVLLVLRLVLKRPTVAPRDPNPVELRLLEQAEHKIELAVINVGQHFLLVGAELVAPPGPLGLPGLDLPAVQPDETKIPLLCPQRHVLRPGTIQFRRRLKRLGGAEQQRRGDPTNQPNPFCDCRLRNPLAPSRSLATFDSLILMSCGRHSISLWRRARARVRCSFTGVMLRQNTMFPVGHKTQTRLSTGMLQHLRS